MPRRKRKGVSAPTAKPQGSDQAPGEEVVQVNDRARHCRVLVMEGRGNGLSDRPTDVAAYADEEFEADALAVMDATETRSAALVSLSAGARWALLLAAEHPERVSSAVFIAPVLPLEPWDQFRQAASAWFDEELDEYVDWMKYNARYWLRDHRGFLEFFFARAFPEPHSTKPIEDTVGWGLETTPEVLIATARQVLSDQRSVELGRRVTCPVLVIHGDEDEIVLHANGAALADLTGGRLLTMEESGHCPHVRDPVAVNLALREFLLPAPAPSTHRRGLRRRRRALWVSSPIGLGHARRDVAIAQELRKLVPDLEIEWLAQDPVTRVLEAHGERIHPASTDLASESRHIELESGSHRLHVFEAWRRMDEILLSNFMVFLDAVRERDYDVWIGDEAWEVDHYLHENPQLKQAAYVWLTDFVGWLPMPARGERDVALTADYNAEMIEHVERFPRVDPGALPTVQGVEVRPFVPDLDLHLAACDIALTQGGLSTTMELTAARRPFLYFPLRDHCEQNFHVRHRLDRYRAGRCMDFDEATAENVAAAIETLLAGAVEYADVETGTAARAARLIAELWWPELLPI